MMTKAKDEIACTKTENKSTTEEDDPPSCSTAPTATAAATSTAGVGGPRSTRITAEPSVPASPCLASVAHCHGDVTCCHGDVTCGDTTITTNSKETFEKPTKGWTPDNSICAPKTDVILQRAEGTDIKMEADSGDSVTGTSVTGTSVTEGSVTGASVTACEGNESGTGTRKLFKTLSLETDINVAPVNWMRGEHEKNVQESCYWDICDAPEMSSIHMAAGHSHRLLAADVISDSRNIKKLLKMEKGDEEVSMAVHRIGKTLLVDEFPIERYIPQRHEKMPKRKKKKNKSNTHVTTISKFLYHTILQNNILSAPESDVIARKSSFSSSDIMVGMGDPLSRIRIELPQIETARPTRDYNRTVYWDFEDIHMLLGNNMPIFGGGEYPAISLKLRDMKEPINVLTGIDCWLDNLICNVPELAMCWHLDGFIQGYELYKTEEIPDLKNSKFDPVVIKDLASNVLKFLKARCVKEGHTYWLYRAKGDDIVKLYDLSSICTGINLKEINPFSTPVAMLCFKVSQRLYEEGKEQDRSTIYTLLQNCLQLIPGSKVYPQMEATAHFMIADLFLSNNFTVAKDNKILLSARPLYECRFDNVQDVWECNAHDLLDSSWEPPQQQYHWRNIATDLQMQKKMSLTHIVSALDVVSHQTDGWAVKLQKLLLFKASQIFLHESQLCKGAIAFTNALLSLITIDAYNALLYFKENKYEHGYGYGTLRSQVLCHVADMLLNEVVTASSIKNTNAICTLDCILSSLSNYAKSFDINCTRIFEWCNIIVPEVSISKRLFNTHFENKEDALLLCLDMYLDSSQFEKDLTVKKLGFVYNELASYNLNLITLEELEQEEVAKKLLKQSFEHYKSALAQFIECSDVCNIALIYSNLGKVMRLSGQLQAKFYFRKEKRGELLFEEKEFYKEAIGYYNEALDTLRKPSVQKDIWWAVSNELSGVYFTMATIMQDYSTADTPDSCEQVVREVTNLLNKSLRISEGLVREGFNLAMGRTGGIHHKLASLYHKQARDVAMTTRDVTMATRDRKRKRLFDLAEGNYCKAMSYFKEDGFEMEYIQVVMEYVGLLQYLSPAPHSALPYCCNLLLSLPAYILANQSAARHKPAKQSAASHKPANQSAATHKPANQSAATHKPANQSAATHKPANQSAATHKPANQSKDPAKLESEVRMLAVMKDQILALLKSMVVLVKQGKTLDGFVGANQSTASVPRDSKSANNTASVPRDKSMSEGLHDAKAMYFLALKGFQNFAPMAGGTAMASQIVHVLNQLKQEHL